MSIRKAVLLVALLNVAYFGVEFAVAVRIGSVSLFADSVDFLEDASVNFLIALALNWSRANRARVGMLLSAIILIPSLAALWQAWEKFISRVPPTAVALSSVGVGALAVNLFCALLLARFRSHGGSLTRGAFLSARNDTIANIAIIGAGILTGWTLSVWPDLIVGLGIVVLNAGAAREVWCAARKERADLQA